MGSAHDEIGQVIQVELAISMHCDACERKVAKTISKIEGVDKFMTDMENQRVLVIGRINPEEVLNKLRKKTGKQVEIVGPEENEGKELPEDQGEMKDDLTMMEDAIFSLDFNNYHNDDSQYITGMTASDEYWRDHDMVTMFNDENVNACSIM